MISPERETVRTFPQLDLQSLLSISQGISHTSVSPYISLSYQEKERKTLISLLDTGASITMLYYDKLWSQLAVIERMC